MKIKEVIKKDLIIGAIGIGTVALLNFWYEKGRKVGYKEASIDTFHWTMNWFDNTFEGLNLASKYEEYVRENADKIEY